MSRTFKEVMDKIHAKQDELHFAIEQKEAAEAHGDKQASCKARCNIGYIQRSLRVLAREAEELKYGVAL